MGRKRRGDSAARQSRVRQLAAILRDYDQSPFQHEAACTHGLRSTLCLRGWDWHDADAEARRLVKAALGLIGARRPSWEMGQREYVLQDYSLTERTRCARCGGRLPEDVGAGRLYCGDPCRWAAFEDKRQREQREYRLAQRQAREAAWKEKQPERTCDHCGARFKPNKSAQRYCRQSCAVRDYHQKRRAA